MNLHHAKFLPVIMMVYVTINLLSGLMVYKVLQISGIILPGGVILFPWTYCITNVVTEVYGYARARQMIWAGVFCSIIFMILSGVIIHLPSPDYWTGQDAFEQIFSYMPRLVFAGVIGNIFGQFANTYLVSKAKIIMNGKVYWLRSIIANSGGEIIYTLIAAPIMYLGVIPILELCKLMVSVCCVKIIYTLFLTPLETTAAFFLKRSEGIDHYDRNTVFTPFKFGLHEFSKEVNLKIVS